MDLKEEKTIGGDPLKHWYYISKGRAIKALLGRDPIGELLDVGAGSGVFSKMLINDGFAAKSVCVDPNYEDEFIDRQGGGEIEYLRSVSAVDADTVIMIDVIEHVEDDVAMMRDYVDRAKAGTRFLISVPAFQYLWSSHDYFLDHHRRYTLGQLRASVEAAGLRSLKTRYFFGLLFPAVAVTRLADRLFNRSKPAKMSQLKPAPGWLHKSLIAIHDFERAAFFPINRAGGVTVLCLAEKPGPVETPTAERPALQAHA